MPSHDLHTDLPGYDERQILHDGCAECEARRDPVVALAALDVPSFARAWRRAFDKYASAGDRSTLGEVSLVELPLLSALWGVQVQLEQRGVELTGVPPGDERRGVAGEVERPAGRGEADG